MTRGAELREVLRSRPLVTDLLVAAAAFAFAVALPDPDRPPGRPVEVSGEQVVLALLACMILLRRRSRPRTVLAAVVALNGTTMLLGEPRSLFAVPALFALYAVAVRTDRRTTAWAWAGTVAALATAGVLSALDAGAHPELLPYVAWAGVAASVGDALRHRRAYVAAVEARALDAERSKDEEARRRVAEERVRIARELHDVVAHHIAVVNVQAGVAAYLLRDDPAAATTALGHVRQAGTAVLDELGDILDVLRSPDDAPGPGSPLRGLAQLDALVASFATAGLVVTWSLSGQPRPIGTAVDLVAYRVLREALTNAQKHGTGTASLTVDHRPRHLRLLVTNPLPDRPPGGSTGPVTRHGLLGMSERVSAVGGTLTTGPSDGHYRVEAVLPSTALPAGAAPAAALAAPAPAPPAPAPAVLAP